MYKKFTDEGEVILTQSISAKTWTDNKVLAKDDLT